MSRPRQRLSLDEIRVGGRGCACCKPSGNVDWRMQESLTALALRRLFALFAACSQPAAPRSITGS